MGSRSANTGARRVDPSSPVSLPQDFSSVKTLEFVNILQNNVLSHMGSGTLLFSRPIGPRQAVISYPNGTGLLPLFERKAARA
jgi:hypothetical protein